MRHRTRDRYRVISHPAPCCQHASLRSEANADAPSGEAGERDGGLFRRADALRPTRIMPPEVVRGQVGAAPPPWRRRAALACRVAGGGLFLARSRSERTLRRARFARTRPRTHGRAGSRRRRRRPPLSSRRRAESLGGGPKRRHRPRGQAADSPAATGPGKRSGR